MFTTQKLKSLCPLALSLSLSLCLLSGCGPDQDTPMAKSSGQVRATSATKLSSYAAARAADQVSFGATPALVAELQQTGLEAWIDAQLAMPVTETQAPSWVIDFDTKNPAAESRAGAFPLEDFFRRALTAPDQLRQRVAWSLFEFIPASTGRPYGHVEYHNLLLRKAFGNYGDLLHDVTIHPMMGFFLNNELNRPNSPECLGCSPNENYARELLQLFSVGVVQLNADGSTQRDAQGKALETYTQRDVEELARALTGWRNKPSAAKLPEGNWANFAYPMVPETLAFLHDRGAKTVMGSPIAADQGAEQELHSVIALLMKHQNIAPFVSLRLIQHLVTSDPTPGYIGRVAAVFRDNGKGVAGDLKAVVRAVLLDPEARRGDQPGVDSTTFGKLREPVQWYSAVLRGLNCKSAPRSEYQGNANTIAPQNQNPDNPPSVFSFFQATDRAPGSNLLAPEQKLLNTVELTSRMGNLHWVFVNTSNTASASNSANLGCELDALGKAFDTSPQAFLDLISARWFRGAMPPTLRSNLQALMIGDKNWQTPQEGALTLLQYALSSPYFGVIK